MHKLIIGTLLGLASLIAQGKDAEIVIGATNSIESKLLAETRTYSISLPEGYEDTDYNYPVLYFSDGRVHFEVMASTANFLIKNNIIPPLIVVGVDTSSHRTRDLTPALNESEVDPNAWYAKQEPGGADKFLSFLEQELIPHINKTYRTVNFKVFSGHSLGGLFSLHAYLTKPNLFDGYIAISPSLWWDNEALVTEAKRLLADKKLPEKHLFLTKGNEKGPMDTGLKALIELFKENNFEHTSSELFDDESHLTVVFNAQYQGLKAIFKQWHLPYQESAKGLDVVKAHNHKVKQAFNVNFTAEAWLMNLGNSERYKKNFDMAIVAYQHNLKLFPKSAYAHFLLAKAYEQKEQLQLAVEYYGLANDLVPEDSPYKHLYLTPLQSLKQKSSKVESFAQ